MNRLATLACVLILSMAQARAAAQRPMSVRVVSDDQRVTILSVKRFGHPVPLQGAGAPVANFVIDADEDGIPCELDETEVRTSNGVEHHPRVNLCQTKGLVALKTARVERPAGLTADPELKWIADHAVDAPAPLLMLTFGVPQTDASVMFSTCQAGSGRIKSLFYGDTAKLNHATIARLDFYGPDVVYRYDAGVSYPDPQGMEESLPFDIEQSARNGFWQALARGHDMAYRSPDGQFHLIDSRRSPVVGQFVKACGGS